VTYYNTTTLYHSKMVLVYIYSTSKITMIGQCNQTGSNSPIK